jgi:hypothetical protein
MLTSITREEKDYLKNFQDYLKSPDIPEEDKDILSKLEYYLTNESNLNYSKAFNNYLFDMNLIKENHSFLPANKINEFWDKHRRHISPMLENLEMCPVCGLSYSKTFGISKSIEHILPKSKYQQYILSPINLVYFCSCCNGSKSNDFDGRIFHPIFSDINCDSEIKVEFFVRNDNAKDVKVTISEDNSDFKYFIKKLFKIQKNYKRYIDYILNDEISALENLMENQINGLSYNRKRDYLNNYFQKIHFISNKTYSVQTDTEKLIISLLNKSIKKQSDLFAQYVLEKSSRL